MRSLSFHRQRRERSVFAALTGFWDWPAVDHHGTEVDVFPDDDHG